MATTATTAAAAVATASILNFDYYSGSVMGSVDATTTAHSRASAAGTGSGDVGRTLLSPMSFMGHAHPTMGADTISMWDSLLARLLTDYEVGFQHISSSSHVCRAGEGS